MALSPMQQSPMYGGSVSFEQQMAEEQRRKQQTFAMNLGRFAMMAGSGIAQGIGTGLAQTDLRNPFVGAGASITGGMQVGNVATSQLMQRMGEEAAFPERLEREREASRARRSEILGQAEEDRGTFKGIASGVQGGAMQPTSSVAQQIEEEYNPMGLTLGLGNMNRFGHVYAAQQGLQSAREQMISEKARRIMLGMGM
jgi:hypothetical protein